MIACFRVTRLTSWAFINNLVFLNLVFQNSQFSIYLSLAKPFWISHNLEFSYSFPFVMISVVKPDPSPPSIEQTVLKTQRKANYKLRQLNFIMSNCKNSAESKNWKGYQIFDVLNLNLNWKIALLCIVLLIMSICIFVFGMFVSPEGRGYRPAPYQLEASHGTILPPLIYNTSSLIINSIYHVL